MAIATPTASALRDRYPTFASVSDGLANAVIAEAMRAVNDDWAVADQQPGILAYAAHLLAAEGWETRIVGVDGSDVSVTGPVELVKVGDTTVKLASDKTGSGSGGSGAEAGDLASTAYGRHYLALRARNIVGVTIA